MNVLLIHGLFCLKVTIFYFTLNCLHLAWASESYPAINNPLFKLVLIDQDGHDLPLTKFNGKTFLLNFIYITCGSTCPLQTRQLVEVQKKIPKDKRQSIQFLSVTVDPQHDTAEILKKYANSMGADTTNWTFATGNEQAIKTLSDQLHVYEPGKMNPQPGDHGNQLYLYDKNGLFRQRYNGTPIDIPRLAREIQQLDRISQALSNKPTLP